jgi:hypothetical protein
LRRHGSGITDPDKPFYSLRHCGITDLRVARTSNGEVAVKPDIERYMTAHGKNPSSPPISRVLKAHGFKIGLQRSRPRRRSKWTR